MSDDEHRIDVDFVHNDDAAGRNLNLDERTDFNVDDNRRMRSGMSDRHAFPYVNWRDNFNLRTH